MARVLIVYGTTEGHTRDLCRFAADALREAGHEVELRAAGEAEAPAGPEGFDAAILAGSLHVGRYQAGLIEYARRRHAMLNAMPSAFISVSLAAAGSNPDDWEGLDGCLAKFRHETGWTPTAVHQAAGAIRYSQYDFFKRLVLKSIARRRGKPTTTSQDYDLTDYRALSRFVLDFAGAAGPRR